MKRKDNLVIVGLPEKDEIAQRRLDDAKVASFCDQLNIPADTVLSTFREGREKGHCVVKVYFKEKHVTERRLLLLNHGTRLLAKDPDCKGCSFLPFIRPDLTENERAIADGEMRTYLKKLRGQDDWNLVIRNGKFQHRREPATGSGNGQAPANGPPQ